MKEIDLPTKKPKFWFNKRMNKSNILQHAQIKIGDWRSVVSVQHRSIFNSQYFRLHSQDRLTNFGAVIIYFTSIILVQQINFNFLSIIKHPLLISSDFVIILTKNLKSVFGILRSWYCFMSLEIWFLYADNYACMIDLSFIIYLFCFS